MKKTLASLVLAGGLALGIAGFAKSAEAKPETHHDPIVQVESNNGFGDYAAEGAPYALGLLGLGIAASGFRVVRPTHEGIVERFGKYKGTRSQGLTYILPLGIDRMYKVPILEMRTGIPPQEVITKDKLNAEVDAVVYYRVKDTQKAIYNVTNYEATIPSLAQTTLRAVIGKMTLADANENRDEINKRLEDELSRQTDEWGIDIMRVELQKIEPPRDVQDSMNNVVKAEQEKIAAKDLAEAAEMQADGQRRAEVKAAEGRAKAVELEAMADANAVRMKAEAEADAIKQVNQAAAQYFKGDAQKYKRLQVTENAFSQNTKFVIPEGSDLVNVIGGDSVVIPKKK